MQCSLAHLDARALLVRLIADDGLSQVDVAGNLGSNHGHMCDVALWRDLGPVHLVKARHELEVRRIAEVAVLQLDVDSRP